MPPAAPARPRRASGAPSASPSSPSTSSAPRPTRRARRRTPRTCARPRGCRPACGSRPRAPAPRRARPPGRQARPRRSTAATAARDARVADRAPAAPARPGPPRGRTPARRARRRARRGRAARSPARASTSASTSPSRHLRSRVSTLPRSSTTSRSSRQAQQLGAPAQGGRPDPRAARHVPISTSARVLARRDRDDLGARREVARARPWRSAPRGRPRRRAAPRSMVSTQRDLSLADLRRGRRRSAASQLRLADRRSATQPACASASALPRVPIRSSVNGRQPADLGAAVASTGRRRVLEPEELAQHAACGRGGARRRPA